MSDLNNDVRISALTALTGAEVARMTDVIPVVDSSETATKKITLGEVNKALSGYANVRDYGAIGDGATNDTAALQAAVAAVPSGGSIFIPAGTYLVTGTITITKPINIFGTGYGSVIRVGAGVNSTTDILSLVPAASAGGIRLFEWSNFRIVAASGTPGRHAIHIDVTATAAFVANATFRMLWLDALGGKAINLTNPTGTDGFFTLSISNNYIANGIYLQRAGDSVTIHSNTITGANVGIELSTVPGAAQIIIEKNNITSAGGAVVVHSGYQVRILNNQIEQVATYTGAGNACIWLQGDITPVLSTEIRSNNINVRNYIGFCVDLGDADYSKIGNNVLDCDTARNHINVGASAFETIIEDSNDFRVSSASAAARITDAGTQTFGPPITVSSFSNSWVAYDATNSPVRYTRNSEGTVQLEGAVKDGTTTPGTTIFTLPAGYRPSKNVYFAVAGNSAGTWEQSTVLVLSSGAVQIMDGANTFLGFGGINFKAAM